MKNLEIKIKLSDAQISTLTNSLKTTIEKYFIDTLIQTDVYFVENLPHYKLKVRTEYTKQTNSDNCYAIYYERPDGTRKISNYEFYKIDDYDQFMKVFGKNLKIRTTVKKIRELYQYKNARIHIDNVENLGVFLEIEVIINNEKEVVESNVIMTEILNMLFGDNYDDYKIITNGYAELTELIEPTSHKDQLVRDLCYYANSKKVYWYVNDDINYLLKQNDVVPCIFTEKKNDGHYILQFDRNIGQDNYKYTAWRKTIGSAYDIRCDVLLIADNTLFDLAGNICKFDDLKRSEVVVSSQFLASFI